MVTLKRRISDKNDRELMNSYLGAIVEDPLPLHGIHYWEISLSS